MKKFYLLLIGIFSFLSGVFAQSAIDPVNGGNFDEGNTFAANGWTVVNSSANKWVVGTAASATPPSSPNTAYISIDGNPANYSYDNTSSHISHFYQVVTLPANAINISLSFQLKGNFENDAGGNLVDGLEVYTNDITAIPVADALPSGVNAIQQFVQISNNIEYVGQSRNLNYYAGKTFLVIFSWINNGDDIGDGPPASVDQASLTYCIKGNPYNVTGGGAFCTGSSGIGVGLASSDTAISYQLYNNGNPVGDPINGTGSALDFGPQKIVGNYTIIGTSACNKPYTMTGSVNISENPLPTASAASNGPLCLGATLNLTSTGGSSYSWTGPNSFTSAVQNPTIDNFSAVEAGTYSVTVTDNNGCSASATIAVAVTSGTANGGSLPSESICRGGSGTLKLTGNSNNPDHWEYTTDSTSVTWNSIVNATTTLNFSGNTVPTFYRAVINDGCSNVYSDTATVSIHNYWIGTTGSDWNTTTNWSDGLVPSTSLPSNATCPTVEIPVVPPHNYPVLSTGPVATITNLQIDAGASVTITGNTIQIAGTITNSGIFDVTNGTVELNGTATQNIDGKTFNNTIPGENNTVENLIISNNVNVANTPGDTLNITGTLSFGTGTAQLQTGNNITLKSSATATASVGVIGSSNAIIGDITVERYSAAINNWQFLAIPTQTTQTINAAWQEGQAPGVIGPIGYGTNITGPVFANGLDFASPNPSMKYWDNATQAYINITGTNMTFPNIENGFFLYIRGDRQATANAASPHIPTVMRTKGSLYKGAVSFNVPGNTYYSIGNPYASRVNFGNIIEATTAITAFYVWDPLIYGTRGAGGYQTLSAANNYWPTVPTAYYAASTPDPYLESGQATFVNNTTATGATLTFNESDKVNGSNLVFRGGDASVSRFLRTFLYNASGKVADGNVVAFNSKYQNKLDANDAVKISNTGENLGLKRDGIILAIEARAPVTASDTIYFNLKNVAKQTYRLGFNPENMQDAGVTAYLVDNYLKTTNEVSLAGATFADFTVNSDTGSYATGRFMIVFKKAVVLPVTFVSIKAAQKDKDIVVSWNVANENNMQEYDVEKSLDGNNFVKVATVNAINNGGGNYQWIDKDAVPGNNYYRIRSVDKNQKTVYSTVVNVLVTNLKTGITIYPNPITDGIIHLQFINQPEGRYRISLFNSLGQLIVAKQIEYAGGNGSENIQWDYNLSHGIYQLEVRRPDGSVVIIKVLY